MSDNSIVPKEVRAQFWADKLEMADGNTLLATQGWQDYEVSRAVEWALEHASAKCIEAAGYYDRNCDTDCRNAAIACAHAVLTLIGGK